MLSIEHNEYYCWKMPDSNWLDTLIEELIHEVELHEFTNTIKLFAEDNWIFLPESRLNEMENFIQLVINEQDQEIFINWKTITYLPAVSSLCWKYINNFDLSQELYLVTLKIILKYIDIFYKLYNSDNLQLTSEIIRNIISSTINTREDTFNISSEKYFYKFFQTINWDLHLSKFEKSTQIDMFYSDWNQRNTVITNKNNTPTEELHIFQTIDWLYTSILEYCYKNNYFPDELKQLSNIIWTIPDAWDAKDYSKSSNVSFLSRLENDNTTATIIRNYHYWETFTYVDQTDNWIKLSIKNKNSETKYFIINKEEMWTILIWLHNKPCRSIVQIQKYLEFFLNKVKEKKKIII